MTATLAQMQSDLESRVALVDEDRALDAELHALVDAIRTREWGLYD